jgi:hypothetical protein
MFYTPVHGDFSQEKFPNAKLVVATALALLLFVPMMEHIAAFSEPLKGFSRGKLFFRVIVPQAIWAVCSWAIVVALFWRAGLYISWVPTWYGVCLVAFALVADFFILWYDYCQ